MSNAKHTRKPKVAFWEKDGRWHISEEYHPTEEDRCRYSKSYPQGDNGPFYNWSKESFDTEQEAEAALSDTERKT